MIFVLHFLTLLNPWRLPSENFYVAAFYILFHVFQCLYLSLQWNSYHLASESKRRVFLIQIHYRTNSYSQAHGWHISDHLCLEENLFLFISISFDYILLISLYLGSNSLVLAALDSQSRGLRFKSTGRLHCQFNLSSLRDRSNECQELPGT